MIRKANEINKILKIKDTFDASDRLIEILQNRTEREGVFNEMLELFDHQLNLDWFSGYFQETLADKKDQGQVFTPPHITDLMARLIPIEKGIISEPCAGTGGMTIVHWNQTRSEENYNPLDYRYICEELSGQAIPFLIFNLAIRGMNAVVVHCNTMTRKSWGAFLISNKENKPDSFSIINRVPYDKESERILNVKFIAELYPEHFDL